MPARPRQKALHVALDELPLQRFLTYRLSRLNAKLNRQAGAILRHASGLKLPEWRVIALLAAHGELNASWIGETAGTDPGLLSRTFRALETRGLILARRSQDDRREVYFTLTRAGRKIHDETIQHMRARQKHLLGALDPAEQAAVFRIVDKLEMAAEAREFGSEKR